MRARWHQLLKLNWVSAENSRDSVRAEVPTARASVSISCDAGGIAEHDVGGAPAARLVRQRDEGRGILGAVQLEHRELHQQPGALGIVAASNSARIAWCSSGDTRTTNSASRLSLRASRAEPRQVEIQRPHLDVGEHVDRMFEPRRHPHRAVRRHQPASLRRRHLHRALGGIDQLRLAMHVGVEPDALAVVARDQMHAVAGGGAGPRMAAIGVSAIFIGDIPSGQDL